MKIALEKKFILKLFNELNEELTTNRIKGELHLLGGAVMCLQFNARPSTLDIDAVFAPKTEIRKMAKKIARNHALHEDWLNDAVKGFLSKNEKYIPFLDLSHLKVFYATAEYLLAMKCLSMRLGKEFHDESDVRFLLRYLNLRKLDEVTKIIQKFYPTKDIPQKTFYALEEFLQDDE